MSALTLTPKAIKGRPIWIRVRGGQHYLFLQDVKYCLKKAEYQERIKLEHPDKHHHLTGKKWSQQEKRFRRLLQYYKWWELRQIYEYKQLGQEPPNLKHFSQRLNLMRESA